MLNKNQALNTKAPRPEKGIELTSLDNSQSLTKNDEKILKKEILENPHDEHKKVKNTFKYLILGLFIGLVITFVIFYRMTLTDKHMQDKF